jgi:hypothetical protein
MRMFHLKPVQPVNAKARAFVSGAGMPDGHIRLTRQIIQRSICAVITDDNEMPHAHVPVIVQEIRQTHPFVALGAEHQNIVLTNSIRSIGNRSQVAAFSKRANPPAFPLEPKAV